MSRSIQLPPRRALDIHVPNGYGRMDDQQHDDFGSLLGVLQRRWRALVAIFGSFVAVVVLVTLLTPKTYTTTTHLIAGATTMNTNSTTNLPVLNALTQNNLGSTPETYVELMQETPIAQRVISDLNLKTSPGTLLSAIRSKPITDTSIIEVAVTWSSAATSANIANDFATVFVNRERELIAGQADAAIGFLSSALPDAENAQHQAEVALAQYENAHPSVYANSQAQGSNVAGIDSKIGQLQVDRGQAQATLAEVASQMQSTRSTMNTGTNVAANPVVGSLQQQLATVNVQLASALKTYTDQYPAVIALREQQRQLEQQIANQPATVVSATNIGPNPVYQSLSQQAATLRSQIASDDAQLKAEKAQLSGLMDQLPLQSQQLADLQQQAKLAGEVYDALEQRYNDATVAKASSLSDVAITQPADASVASVQPNLRTNTMLAVILGLVLAIGGVFAIEFFDNTYKDERDVTRDLPLPVLANVPSLPAIGASGNGSGNGKQAELPWLRALTVESFLQIVSALHYSSDKPLHSLAVASPLPGDGKSTLCLNLATALAEFASGVVLVDADLRRPTLHKALGLTNDCGLSDVLVGSTNALDAVQPTKHRGLDFMPAGPMAPVPLKLLQSERFERMLAKLLERYRMVIFDTPPILSVFDCALISAKVDGTVLVLSAGKTDSRSTKRALKRLTQVGNPNVLGVILNRATPDEKYYAYYHQSGPPMMLSGGDRP